MTWKLVVLALGEVRRREEEMSESEIRKIQEIFQTSRSRLFVSQKKKRKKNILPKNSPFYLTLPFAVGPFSGERGKEKEHDFV